jgi:hypothetical protein
MRGAIPPFSQYVFMAWCLVKHRDKFDFSFIFAFSLMFTVSKPDKSIMILFQISLGCQN